MAEVTLSSKNQIVVPREAREALGLKPGDKLLVAVRGSRVIVLERPSRYRDALRQVARGAWPEDHIRKERQSWE